MMVEMQLVILLRDIIPSRPNLLGYVIGFSAAGSVLAAIWLSRKKDIKQFGLLLVLCFICVAIGYGFMGNYQTSWPIATFFTASLISGFGLGIAFVLQTYAVKREIKGKDTGRVNGLLSMAQGISFGIGVAFSGTLINIAGAREAFVLIGAICLCFALLCLILRKPMTLNSDTTA
jgi:MFS family permease